MCTLSSFDFGWYRETWTNGRNILPNKVIGTVPSHKYPFKHLDACQTESVFIQGHCDLCPRRSSKKLYYQKLQYSDGEKM